MKQKTNIMSGIRERIEAIFTIPAVMFKYRCHSRQSCHSCNSCHSRTGGNLEHIASNLDSGIDPRLCGDDINSKEAKVHRTLKSRQNIFKNPHLFSLTLRGIIVSVLFASLLLFTAFIPSADAGDFTLLHGFTSDPEGATPHGGLYLLDGELYGTATTGGAEGDGTIYKISTDGSGFTLLHTFNYATTGGRDPSGTMIMTGDSLYGVSNRGGNPGSGVGVIYSIETDGSGYTILHAFAGDPNDGATAWGRLLYTDGYFWGTTVTGGSENQGAVYKISTDGTGLTLLHSFLDATTDGDTPYGGMILIGSTFYGTASRSGANNKGTLYSVETDGTGYTLLHSFNGTNGETPYGMLTQAGDQLWGLTSSGGSQSVGVIFNINTDGSGYTVVHNFGVAANDGEGPWGTLLLSGDILYGMTEKGGTIANGTMFQIGTDGTGYTKLYDFLGVNNAEEPAYDELIISGGVIYGVTEKGGASSAGAIFAFETFNRLTWNGGGADSYWSTAANWGGTAIASGDKLTFGSGDFAPNNDLTGYSFATITINATGFTLSGNQITLTSSFTQTTGTSTCNIPIALASGDRTFDIAGTLTQGGVVSGSGGITKTGTGNLRINAANTYTGATNVNVGTLQYLTSGRLSDSSAVTVASGALMDLNNISDTIGSLAGAGNVYLGSGTLTAGNDNTSTAFSGVISETGQFVKSGTGTLTMSGSNTYTGDTTVSAGTLAYGAGDVLSNSTDVIVSIGAVLDLADYSDTIRSVSGEGSVDLGSGTLTVAGGTATYSGDMSGTGNFTKTSSGTATLEGANTYTGVTTVSGGTLTISGGGSLASGTVDITGSTLLYGNDDVLSDTCDVTLNSSGTLDIGAYTDTVGGFTITAGGRINGTSGVLISTTDYDVEAGTLDGILGGSVGLTKTTAGLAYVYDENTYTGTTAVNAGILRIYTDNPFSDSSAVTIAAGATLDMHDDYDTIGSLAGAGDLKLGLNSTGLVSAGADNTSTEFSGVISETGGLEKIGTGTLTLSGTNTYTGDTTVSAGTLAYGAGDVLSNSTDVIVSIGAVLDLADYSDTIRSVSGEGSVDLGSGTLTVSGGTATYSGDMSGTGNFTKTSGGTITLEGANTYTGVTTVSGGTLTMAFGGSLASGTVNVSGAAGTVLLLGTDDALSDTCDVTVSSSGTIDIGAYSDTVGSFTITAGRVNGTSGVLTSATDYDVEAGAIDCILGGSVGLTKTTAGLAYVYDENTYTGTTAIDAGTIRIYTDNAFSDSSAVTIALGATLEMHDDTDTVGSLAGAGNVTMGSLGTGLLSAGADNTSTEFSGVISETGGIEKVGTGTMTLSGANTYTGDTTVSEGTLLYGASDVLSNSTDVIVSIGAELALADYSDTVRSVAGDGDVDLGSGTLTVSGGTATYSGDMSGTGNFTKTSGGTITLEGANTYTGVTTVSGGTLTMAFGGSLASGTVNVSGAAGTVLLLGTDDALSDSCDVTISSAGTIDIGAYSDTVGSFTITAGRVNGTSGVLTSATDYDVEAGILDGILGGSVGLTKTTTGTANIYAENTYTGATTISAGTLYYQTGGGLSDSSAVTVASGAVVDLNDKTDTIGSLAGAGNVMLGGGGAGILTSGADDTSTEFSGVMSEAGQFVKSGTGTLTMSGANTYTGDTTVSAGTLMYGASNVLSNSTDVIVSSGAIFDLADYSDTVRSFAGSGDVDLGSGTIIITGGNVTHSGVISGTGDFTKTSTGTQTLQGANTYTGVTTVSGGTLTVSGGGSLESGTVNVSAGTLLYGNGDVLSDACDVTVSSTGILNIGTYSDTVGSVILNGGTLSGSGTLVSGTDYDIRSGRTYIGLGGSAGLTKTTTGLVYMYGANTYTGATTISAGTLYYQTGASLSDSTAVTVASGAVLDLNAKSDTIGSLAGAGSVLTGAGALTVGSDNTSTEFSGAISESLGTLTKIGTGKQTLSGSNTYTGVTTVNAGTLAVNGGITLSHMTVNSDGAISGTGTIDRLTLNGTVAPGNSVGTLNADDGVTWNTGGTYEWEINDAAGTIGVDPGWDLLNITGALTISAASFTIDINSLSGTSPGNCDNFSIFDDYTWKIAATTTGITGFDSEIFTLDYSSFTNSIGAGTFSIEQSGNDLNLLFAGVDPTLDDGYPDIVISSNTTSANSYIYWGADSNSFATKTELSTLSASGNAVTDVNNDGNQDIVFANYHNGSTGLINSYVYWGADSNPFSSKTDLPAQYAIGSSVADINDDGYLDIVFSNFSTGSAYNINSYIYWGAATSPYSSKTELTTSGARANSVVDLNDDGYLDIVFSNYVSATGSDRQINSWIYWGAATNPYSSSTNLPTMGAEGNSVADLNNDGCLDIVFSNYYNNSSYVINSYVYWGAATNPYSSRTDLPTNGARGNSIADLNADGWLDIVFSNRYGGNNYIYWGAATNPFSSKTDLANDGNNPYGNAVGDLNLDGWLDIVFANLGGGNSYIYWGAETNPYSSKTDLATSDAYGVSIANGNIWSGNEAFGNVVPLWATQGDYDTDILNAWEYGFIATKYYTISDGNFTFTDEDIAKLIQMFKEGEDSLDPDPIQIGRYVWSYYSETIGGHNTPEAWYDSGIYYFQMGSGVRGDEVPEPSTIIIFLSLLILLITWHIRRPRRAAVVIDTNNPKTKARRGMRKTLLSMFISIILIGSFAVYAQAEPFTLLHVFPWTDDGQRPRGTLTLSDGTLYGATSYGGDSNSGVVFSMDTSGGSYTQLHQFVGQPDDGAVPYWAKLTLSGDTLYGMTVDGGTSNIGTVYSLSTDGGSFTILHHFTGGADDGADPYGALTLSGDSLYGMTYAGGDSNWGVVFSLDTAGGSFTVLHDFIGGLDDGGVPEGTLLLSGSTLYGEAFGGAESGGMIFSIDTSGASFTIVHSFTPGPGGGPNRDITIDGDKIYGMTGSGGVDGTVYRLDTAGGGYTVLHEFAGGTGDGSRPFGTVMINDGVAYGMTFDGGDSDRGVLFSVGTDGEDYAILHEFLGGEGDGEGPQGDLIMSGVMLYGMTQYGGSGQPTTYGTVFSFDATVPEPSTVVMMVVFIAGFGWWYRKRNGKSVIARSGSDEAISKINEVQRDCHALRARNDI